MSESRAKEYVLVVDVGNTSTSLGLFADDRVTAVCRMDTALASRKKMGESLLRRYGRRRIRGVALASVAPRMNALWQGVLERLWPGIPILWARHDLELGLPITYPRPAQLGADRLANVCGAMARHKPPMIVADFGTAVTFDVVTRRDGFIGGVIAPGLPLMFSYLAEKTELLPALRPGALKNRVGKSTEEAMQMGAQWGYCGMVREILTQLQKASGLKKAALCATGGYAGWVLKGLDLEMTLEPDLTLYGLGRMLLLNSAVAKPKGML